MTPDEAMLWIRRAVEDRPRTAQPSTRGFPPEDAVVSDTEVPDPVRAACARYRRLLLDFGGAWQLRWRTPSGELFAVYAATDGDEAWLEVFDAAGGTVGGAIFDGRGVRWVDCAEVRADAQLQAAPPEP